MVTVSYTHLDVYKRQSDTWAQTGTVTRTITRPAQSGSPSGVQEGWAPLSCTLISVSGGRAQSSPLRARSTHRQEMLKRSQLRIFCRSTPSGLPGLQGLQGRGGRQPQSGAGGGHGGGHGLDGFSPQAWQVPVSYTHLDVYKRQGAAW